MTSETSPYPQTPPPPPAPRVPAAPATGWSGSDLVVGGALVVLLIALFLPWFSGTVQIFKSAAVSGAAAGTQAHGYLWVVFVLAIVALIVLVARDAIDQLPGNLPSPEQMLVGATGLALVLTVLGLVQKPSSGALISIGWSYGGFIALLAALVAFLAASGVAARLRPRSPGTTA
ncbi:MAG TPA: hypothetical protein VGH53_31340 [Streptosporangiaceae bacterium]|jgi:uncharacterized membrane protein